MTTTKRTSIRRRLAVPRTANRPPWGGRKVGHGSILAPLAAVAAGTLAATVAVGAGIALARAERNRRSARAFRARDRRFALWPKERLTDGLRRMALTQLDLAIELLGSNGGAVSAATAVHETRKALKRLGTLIGLLEEELGEAVAAREKAVVRSTSLHLAGARDSEVLVSTLDGLVRRHPKKLRRRRGVAKLRCELVAERDTAAERAHDDALARAEALGELCALRGRVESWSFPHREGIEAVEPGLRRVYREGRERHGRAGGGKGHKGRAMHQWRKRVKELRYAAEMLDRRVPGGREEPGGARRRERKRGRAGQGKDEGHFRRLARRADELGELLGEEHDLAVLAERLRTDVQPGQGNRPEIGRSTGKVILKLIARRRRRLRGEALRRGARLYRRTPKRFVRRLGDAYARAARA
jgi:hypothetical protein